MNNEKNNNKDLISVKETEHSSIDEILDKETFLAPLTDIYESDDEFVLTANMPGVPREMMKMMEVSILNTIKSFFQLPDYKTYLIRTTGIAESRLFEKLEKIS